MDSVAEFGRTTSEILDCVLTPDEQRDRGRQLAEALGTINAELAEQKIVKDGMKERLETLEAESDRLAEIVRQGKEPRPVSIRTDFDDSKGLVHRTRLDTGELIATRTMTEDEKQRALPFASRKVN